MKIYSWPVYFVAVLVAVISFFVTSRFSQNEWAEILTATPIPIALITILYKIFRDNLAFERKRILQNENNDFILSATSHMANLAFDKHAVFAEKYVAEVHCCIATLIQTGATKNALELAHRLRAIRLEFTVWETDAVSKTLNEFEKALRTIGAQVDGLRDLPDSDEKSKKLKEVYDIFNKVLGFENAPNTLSDDIIWSEVIKRIRELLGISKLTEIRQNYLDRAYERSK
jgi:hypothetical protein